MKTKSILVILAITMLSGCSSTKNELGIEPFTVTSTPSTGTESTPNTEEIEFTQYYQGSDKNYHYFVVEMEGMMIPLEMDRNIGELKDTRPRKKKFPDSAIPGYYIFELDKHLIPDKDSQQGSSHNVGKRPTLS